MADLNRSAKMFTFLIIFGFFAGIPAALMTPAFIYARRQNRRRAWIDLFVHIPAFVALYCLVSSGFGRPQSLGNLIEFPILGAAAIAVVYLKVFLVDRCTMKQGVTTAVSACLLITLAVVLRLVMPTMPE